MERAEDNPFFTDRRSNSRIAKCFYLQGSFRAIHRIQTLIESGVAAKLGDPERQCRQDPEQGLDANPFGARGAFRGLSIEIAAVMHLRTALPQRDSQPARPFQQHGPHRLMSMHMLMRIKVRGLLSGKASKGVHLMSDLVGDGLAV